MSDFIIKIADNSHFAFADEISQQMEESAKARGTGIARRSPEYIRLKMEEGKAIIALTRSNRFVGFCYCETWGHGKYVANSGLIVVPEFRKSGVARSIKHKAFALARKKYPEAKVFGLTTSLAVMKLNSELGYYPVPFSELTDDKEFWKGCSSCVNYPILTSKEFKNCFCTGMLYDPQDQKRRKWHFVKNLRFYKSLSKIKQALFMKKETLKEFVSFLKVKLAK
ncbi:GNAT family N-acetyltransferase [soil metagenome]